MPGLEDFGRGGLPMPDPKSSEKKSKTAYERCLSKLPSRIAKQREISSAEAIGDLCQPSSSEDNRISEENKINIYNVHSLHSFNGFTKHQLE